MFGAQKLDRNHVLSASNAVWEPVSGFNFHCLSEGSFDQTLHFFTSPKWLRLLPAHYHCLRVSSRMAMIAEIYLHEFPPNCPAHRLSLSPLLPLGQGTVSAGGSTWVWMPDQEAKGWEMGRGIHTYRRRKCSSSKWLQLALNGFSSLSSFSFKPQRNSL